MLYSTVRYCLSFSDVVSLKHNLYVGVFSYYLLRVEQVEYVVPIMEFDLFYICALSRNRTHISSLGRSCSIH